MMAAISWRAIVLCTLFLTGTLPLKVAMAEPSIIAIENKNAPASDAELTGRVAGMRRILDDSNARFSASAAISELNVLRAFIGERPDLLPERREVLSMIGAIVARSPLMDFEEGLKPLEELMTLGAGDERPAKRRMLDHYTYGELAGGYAQTSGNKAQHALAANQYEKAAALADELPDYNEDQRAGIREKQAYELHEAGRYEEALAVNLDVLPRGERLFGTGSPKLKTVLTNIAQNLHALERRQEIEPYLIRVQTIAEDGNDLQTVQDMLFQRGVLSYELNRMEKARELMLDRIARLQAAGEAELLATARQDYEELEKRISGR
jgi:tetratricopeptide (TPR) repeat protein